MKLLQLAGNPSSADNFNWSPASCYREAVQKYYVIYMYIHQDRQKAKHQHMSQILTGGDILCAILYISLKNLVRPAHLPKSIEHRACTQTVVGLSPWYLVFLVTKKMSLPLLSSVSDVDS